MAFDWLRALDQHKVSYATAGKNVSRGNFVVKCPFCAHEDQGMHMSVALKGRGWRCLRRPMDHKGQHAGRLLAALIGCSIEQAYRLVGDAVFVPSDFMAAVNAAMADAPLIEDMPGLKMPAEFIEIDTKLKSKLAFNYLLGRGFAANQISALTRRWGLRFATSGAYLNRIIFPVIMDGKLCSWTGRHVGSHPIRYKTLSQDAEKATDEGYQPALGPISDFLLFHDQIQASDADTLYLVEGPFDALKVCVLGRSRGAIATCCFTAQPSDAQIGALHELFPTFKRKVLLLDRGTIANSLRVAQAFASLGLEIGELPGGIKDPGDLNQDQFDDIHEAA